MVSDNLIFDYMQVLDDGGGVYTQGLTGTSLADGEKVTGNVIHDQWGLGKNVYTDNGCTYETVQGNVLYHAAYANVGSAGTPTTATTSATTTRRCIAGNYWEQGDRDGDNKGVVTSGNHILSDPSTAPADDRGRGRSRTALPRAARSPYAGGLRSRSTHPRGHFAADRLGVRDVEPVVR